MLPCDLRVQLIFCPLLLLYLKFYVGAAPAPLMCSSAPADMAHEYMSMPIMQVCKKEPQATENKSYGTGLAEPVSPPSDDTRSAE